MRRAIVVATRNRGKLAELRPMLEAVGFDVIDLDAAGLAEDAAAEEAVEAFATFEENAIAKGRYYRALLGRPVVADDSGLAVDALGGAPGVRSRRWAVDQGAVAASDAANNRTLARAIHGMEAPRAAFVCAAAYCDGSYEAVERGVVRGRLVAAARGEMGFGYDPHFVPDEGDGHTFGEMSAGEKAALSHRARAFQALVGRIRSAPRRD